MTHAVQRAGRSLCEPGHRSNCNSARVHQSLSTRLVSWFVAVDSTKARARPFVHSLSRFQPLKLVTHAVAMVTAAPHDRNRVVVVRGFDAD